MQEKLFQLALHATPGIGPVSIKNLISYTGSASNVYKTTKASLLKIPGIGEKTAHIIKDKQWVQKAEDVLKKCEKDNISITFYTDSNYPSRFKNIFDAPVILFSKGNINFNPERSIGIVGTRKATDYGKTITKEIIEGVKKYNPLIISGLAYGIDIEAHKQSLHNELPTIAIMGSGVDVIYPNVHQKIADKMVQTIGGGIVSEFFPGTEPSAGNFPARNRIIVGLADIIIIVETGLKGGSLISAEIANSYQKDILAVPGNINQTLSQGCNHLILNHKAHIYTKPEDIATLMNWDLKNSNNNSISRISSTIIIPDNFSIEEKKILQYLKEKEKGEHIDLLSWGTQIPINQLFSTLLQLEFAGYIKSLPGKYYKFTTPK